MSEFRKRATSVLTSRGLYIALALVVIAGGAVGYLQYLNRASVQEASSITPVIEVQPQTEPERIPKVTVTKPDTQTTEVAVAEPAELLPQVVSPLDGTTVTVFSMTELMYDDTMADWRTHNGLDIQAGEGDVVKTAAAGTVSAVRNDELMGTTVVVEHSGGYVTTYSSLQTNPPVQVGQTVAAGDTIGAVGSTATAESNMGPHLHFSVSKDGELIDPSEYVK